MSFGREHLSPCDNSAPEKIKIIIIKIINNKSNYVNNIVNKLISGIY